MTEASSAELLRSLWRVMWRHWYLLVGLVSHVQKTPIYPQKKKGKKKLQTGDAYFEDTVLVKSGFEIVQF
jgi:hypothetical protein